MIGGALAALVASVLTPWGGHSLDSAAAATKAAPSQPAVLLPDLVALRAQDLHISRNGSTRKLRFESGLGNVGDGPVEVRPDGQQDCPEGKHHASQVMYKDADGNGRYALRTDTRIARRSAGCMLFHPYHNHWHFEAASRYTIFRPQRPAKAIVAQRKMSFCLRDSKRVPEAYGTFRYAEHYGKCSRYSPQGISVGWVDVYQSYLAGQALPAAEVGRRRPLLPARHGRPEGRAGRDPEQEQQLAPGLLPARGQGDLPRLREVPSRGVTGGRPTAWPAG